MSRYSIFLFVCFLFLIFMCLMFPGLLGLGLLFVINFGILLQIFLLFFFSLSPPLVFPLHICYTFCNCSVVFEDSVIFFPFFFFFSLLFSLRSFY